MAGTLGEREFQTKQREWPNGSPISSDWQVCHRIDSEKAAEPFVN
jgi:hypothetical protein